MANLDRKMGFKPKNIKNADSNRYLIATSQVTRHGDVIRMGTSGLVRGTSSGTTAPIVGIQNGAIIDETDGAVNATAVSGDIISVWDDPNEVFVAQIASHQQTDAYVTRTTSLCFDEAGSAGAQYIDDAASSLDSFKVMRASYEENGARSTTGTYANVECRINPVKHLYGVAGVTS